MLTWALLAGDWNMRHLGYGLLIVGGLTQVAESYAQNSAKVTNVPFAQTDFGKIVAPVEAVLPFSLGWTLIIAGAGLVWLLPLVSKKG